MNKKKKTFIPLSGDMMPFIHSLIDSSPVSVKYDNVAVIYEMCIVGDRYMELSRDFFTNDNKTIKVEYNIFIYEKDTKYEENVATMTVPANRRIFTPREQKIIDVFNACSRRIIQQEMQLIQNKIMNLTADYTHN
ncbi:MAG: hypothetical protein IKB10_01995 [Alphaproteobacteria bacterium]|nr:hypothetical protein [Alphaproteobacteria bacterium]